MSKIAAPDRRSTGFQTHLERLFMPGRFAKGHITMQTKDGTKDKLGLSRGKSFSSYGSNR
jgi:hypothetical protein